MQELPFVKVSSSEQQKLFAEAKALYRNEVTRNYFHNDDFAA